ncbi:hypothetical protein Nepgr_006963 [Nepenthes gracilis]|uniref:Uncharacterized protein n=1 Tax=Nepenthes gracilis TaxID=150966 RepID=A0AAD3S625_NEPGR|nr:hypothetical protein Nepgr_006963 [Nepenthes gracilis]
MEIKHTTKNEGKGVGRNRHLRHFFLGAMPVAPGMAAAEASVAEASSSMDSEVVVDRTAVPEDTAAVDPST